MEHVCGSASTSALNVGTGEEGMNSASLMEAMAAWLDPLELLKLPMEHAVDPQGVERELAIPFVSTKLTSPNEGGVLDLIFRYLHSFEVQPRLVQFMERLVEQELPEDAKEWLAALRFQGKVEVPFLSGNQGAERTLFIIYERAAVARLVTQPIRILVRRMELYAPRWRANADMLGGQADGFYPAHTWPSQYAAEIEISAARWYGCANAGTGGKVTYMANLDHYRAVTIAKLLPMDQTMWEVGRTLAQAKAAETHRPAPAKGVQVW
jgi:hypothetical protein